MVIRLVSAMACVAGFILASCNSLTSWDAGVEHASIFYITAPDSMRAGETLHADLHHALGSDYFARLDTRAIPGGVELTVWHREAPGVVLFCGTPPQPILASYETTVANPGPFRIVVRQPSGDVLEKSVIVL